MPLDRWPVWRNGSCALVEYVWHSLRLGIEGGRARTAENRILRTRSALFAVASQRTRQYFSPPQSFTLWSLSPSDENDLDEAMIGWAHEGRTWPTISASIEGLKLGGLDHALGQAEIGFKLIKSLVPTLKPGPEGKTIQLPEAGKVTDGTIALLAAAFSRSDERSFLLPIVPVKGGDPE